MDNDRELARYVLRYFPPLMTESERLAHGIGRKSWLHFVLDFLFVSFIICGILKRYSKFRGQEQNDPGVLSIASMSSGYDKQL